MKQAILSTVFIALSLAAASLATAGVRVIVNPFGFVAVAPPVVYAPGPYYAPPPVVYVGGGSWGDRRGGGRRDHGGRGGRRR
jgi:hypothetical protein